MKPWYWEMERAGWGPHYYLSLEFAPEDAPLLRQRLFDSPPQGFKPEPRDEGQQYSWGGWPLESGTLMWSWSDNSEWGFAFLLLNGPRLKIEHGWGTQGEADSVWLRELLSGSQVALQKWSISAGGEGYNPSYCRSGHDHSSLLRYMESAVPTPDWTQVESQLRHVLLHQDQQGKFRLSECLVDSAGETMRAVLLYNVPRAADGAWLPDSGGQELVAIAREVGELCDVPYSASGASIHAPEDWYQIVGGSMTFGIRSQR